MAFSSRRNKIFNLLKQPKITNIEDLYSRPLNFNDFNLVFENPNEYENSLRYLETYDLSSLKQITQSNEKSIDFLFCNEVLTQFDDSDIEQSKDQNNIDIFHDSDDSRDKDYIPDSFENSSEDECMSAKPYHKAELQLNKQIYKIKPNTSSQEENAIERMNQSAQLEVEDVPNSEIQQIIQQIDDQSNISMLTYHEVEKIGTHDLGKSIRCEAENLTNEDADKSQEHGSVIMNEDTDGLAQNEDKGVTKACETDNLTNEDADKSQEHGSEIINKDTDGLAQNEDKGVTKACETDNLTNEDADKSQEHGSEIINKDTDGLAQNEDKGVTKAGKPRKRRKFEESLKDRQNKKKRQNEEKQFMKEPCNSSCKKRCITKITDEQRQEIHDKYIDLNWEAQGIFIKCFVEENPVSRRTQAPSKEIKRTVTYKYFFKPQNEKIEVCKTFFLCTLGYHRANNSRVVTALKKPLESQKIKRGRYERTNKIDKEIIKNHILTYNPCISHYRREHAPNRLYLPSDITVTMMHEQYCILYPDKTVSLEFYRQVVKNDLNISFAHLGHEECEQCAEFEKHNSDHVNNIRMDCETCESYRIHKERYQKTRTAYKKDVELAPTDPKHIYYSVDLQKVIMLPRMEQFKAAIFCTRIVAYNESFVPLGTTSQNVPFAVLWNDTISGRNQEDIISTFRAFLIYKRDAEHIILWLDNCAAQNKNWALFSFLIEIVNSSLISAKTITLKYLESGHTFMSADSFHHQVEKSLKKMDKVYDFPDFIECVRLSNSGKNYIKVMKSSDFYCYQDCSSQYKLRKKEPRVYLKDMAVITVERGHYTLKYKTSHNCNNDYLTLDFLQTKIMKTQTFSQTLPKSQEKGITAERKTEILTKLVPLMPENRREYWRNLPVSTSM